MTNRTLQPNELLPADVKVPPHDREVVDQELQIAILTELRAIRTLLASLLERTPGPK